ncbi:receptor-like protein eix2 [Quercus suber]|uniref:Receptor-like protein eix2 n=1 Tax=Quercus suber TaxID=58331 RepID=A0AAW0M5G8_QUESU
MMNIYVIGIICLCSLAVNSKENDRIKSGDINGFILCVIFNYLRLLCCFYKILTKNLELGNCFCFGFKNRLNLSNNNLIGKIPSSTQLQSFDASNFFGNKLCGPPLIDNCTIKDVQPNTEKKECKAFSGVDVDWFYVSMRLGFVVVSCLVTKPLRSHTWKE